MRTLLPTTRVKEFLLENESMRDTAGESNECEAVFDLIAILRRAMN
jgi:hypothetical protein